MGGKPGGEASWAVEGVFKAEVSLQALNECMREILILGWVVFDSRASQGA